MLLSKYAWSVVLVLVSVTTLTVHSKIALSKTKKSDLHDYIQKTTTQCMQQNQIPGMAIVLYANNKPYLFHYGYANKQTKTPITDKTIFEIGSLSKLFTCILLSQEVLNGTMQLDDPVNEHISRLAQNNHFKDISLEKLGTHTAGFPFNAPWGVRTTQAHFDYFLAWKPSNKYELPWEYSNHGIELLRVSLEESLHDSFENLLVSKILNPLGMDSSGITISDQNKPFYAQGYDKRNMPAPRWNHPFYIGTGALRATSLDMLKFLKAAIGLPGTPASIKKAMKISQTPYVEVTEDFRHGLGWEIYDLKCLNSEKIYSAFNAVPARQLSKEEQVFDSNVVLAKGGTTDGFHAYIGVIPKKKTGIVVMMNHAFPPMGWKVIKKLGKQILAECTHRKVQRIV